MKVYGIKQGNKMLIKYILRHKRLSKKARESINKHLDLNNGEFKPVGLQPQKALSSQKIIWQYWGQGVDDRDALPEVVKICFDSVDKYKGDYTVIRLCDDTIKEYLDLPDFVYDKLANNDRFTITFFSDLLRLALLDTYGGVWLDATILLTKELDKEFYGKDFFAFQRSFYVDKDEQKFWEKDGGSYWRWNKHFKVRLLSSVIFAKKGNVVIQALFRLMYDYWERENKLWNYYICHIFFQEIIDNELKDYNQLIISDTLPHLLQSYILFGDTEYYSVDRALQESSMHKLTYFKKEEHIQRFREVIKELSERNIL